MRDISSDDYLSEEEASSGGDRSRSEASSDDGRSEASSVDGRSELSKSKAEEYNASPPEGGDGGKRGGRSRCGERPGWRRGEDEKERKGRVGADERRQARYDDEDEDDE